MNGKQNQDSGEGGMRSATHYKKYWIYVCHRRTGIVKL